MGFFSRRSKDDFNPEDVEIPDISYSSVAEAVYTLVNEGATDTKICRLTLDDGRVVDVLVHGENVVYAKMSYDDMFDGIVFRFQWVDSSLRETNEIETVLESIDHESSILAAVSQTSGSAPRASEMLHRMIDDNTVRVLESTDGVEVVKAENIWDSLPDSIHDVSSYTPSYAIHARDIYGFLKDLYASHDKAAGFLGGSSMTDSFVKTILDDGSVPKDRYSSCESDSERYVFIVGTPSPISIQEIVDRSYGFSINEILSAVEALEWRKIVTVENDSVSEEELSLDIDSFENESDENGSEYSIDEKDLSENSLSENEEDSQNFFERDQDNTEDVENLSSDEENGEKAQRLRIVIPASSDVSDSGDNDSDTGDNDSAPQYDEADDDGDGWSFSSPPVDENDDGGFVFESGESDEYLTEGISSDYSLLPYLVKVLEESSSDGISTERVIQDAEYNDDLERTVLLLEKDIILLRKEYDESFGEYQNLALDAVVDQISSDSSVKLDGDVVEIDSAREKSNDDWFELEKIEKRRNDLNETRRNTLLRVRSSVVNLEADHLQELLHVIDTKINGIDAVNDIAFHNKKDDIMAMQDVDPSFIVQDSYNEEDTPLFFSLAEKHGFNPLSSSDLKG